MLAPPIDVFGIPALDFLAAQFLRLLREAPFWFVVAGTTIMAYGALQAGIAAWRGWQTGGALDGAMQGRGTAVLAEGWAAPDGAPRPATLTGKPCVWEYWRVEEWRSRKGGGDWILAEEGAGTAPFRLRTAQGTILVLPEGAAPTALPEQVWEGRSPRPEAPGQSGWAWLLALFLRAYRYTEIRVTLNQPLFVLGTALPREARDPPELLGRIAAGDGAFMIGGEPPRQVARRSRRRALRPALTAVVTMAGILLIWLARQ